MNYTTLRSIGLIFSSLVTIAHLHAENPVSPSGAAPDYTDRILTPAPSPKPRINSARVFGVRAGSPFLFKIAATGTKPLSYSAKNLPRGLSLDATTGIITGKIAADGEYRVQVSATNSLGADQRELRIVVGEKLALTPPMGWNSWYCWSESVSQENTFAMAQVMAEKLADYGWTYINIDDCWQGLRGGKYNAIQPNEKFPDMAGLAKKIHALGLKFGIYSTPWMGSYAGFIGGSAPSADGDYSSMSLVPVAERIQPTQIFGRAPGSAMRQAQVIGARQLTDRDAMQYADWGVDYIKYDWKNSTFTSPLMVRPVKRTDKPKTPESIIRLADELLAVDRDIVLSLSPISEIETSAVLAKHTNLWRITKDIKADWASLDHVFELADWFAITGPGHWPDPDMLQVGSMGVVNLQNRTLRPSPLTADEQFLQVSFWCLQSAPLLLSCDLTALDAFTLSLITNSEVIDINQDALGKPGVRVQKAGNLEVWRKPLEDGSIAVGFFNRGDSTATIAATWPTLEISGAHTVRDLWRQQDVATSGESFSTEVAPHGVRLVRIYSKK